MNRAELRDLVRTYLDDHNEDDDARYPNDVINRNLAFAAEAITTKITAACPQHLQTTVLTALNSGQIVCPDYKTVIRVLINYGRLTGPIRAGSKGQRSLNYQSTNNTVSVDLVLKNEFPTDDVTPVLYCQLTPRVGNFDEAVAMYAAEKCAVVDTEAHPKLQAMAAAALKDLMDLPIPPKASVKSLQTRIAGQWANNFPQLYWYEDSNGILKVYL